MMRRATDKLAVVCTAICILCLAGVGVWSGTVLDTNRQADQAAATAAQIQRERKRNIRTNCEDTNRRHDATVRQLRRLVDELPPGPRKVRAVQGMAGSVAVIQALAPKRDCRALVARQVNTK